MFPNRDNSLNHSQGQNVGLRQLTPANQLCPQEGQAPAFPLLYPHLPPRSTIFSAPPGYPWAQYPTGSYFPWLGQYYPPPGQYYPWRQYPPGHIYPSLQYPPSQDYPQQMAQSTQEQGESEFPTAEQPMYSPQPIQQATTSSSTQRQSNHVTNSLEANQKSSAIQQHQENQTPGHKPFDPTTTAVVLWTPAVKVGRTDDTDTNDTSEKSRREEPVAADDRSDENVDRLDGNKTGSKEMEGDMVDVNADADQNTQRQPRISHKSSNSPKPPRKINPCSSHIFKLFRRRKKGRNVPDTCDYCADTVKNLPVVEISEITPQVMSSLKNLLETDYFKNFYALFHDSLQELRDCKISSTPSGLIPKKIVCFGLGSFSRKSDSMYQLAFLILLQKALRASVEIFDPIFTPEEKEVLFNKYEFRVLTEDEEGIHPVREFKLDSQSIHEFTLFYMPHCPYQLVNNVLHANWSSEQIKNCILISNSFSLIVEEFKDVPEEFNESIAYIKLARTIGKEYSVENSFASFSQAFYKMSIHSFPIVALVVERFWADKKRPENSVT